MEVADWTDAGEVQGKKIWDGCCEGAEGGEEAAGGLRPLA